jgi:predicted nucleic acid-binding protein
VAYWDTSALFKLYVRESDSPYFLNLAGESDEAIATSTISAAELLCAAYRKERAGELIPGGAAAVLQAFLKDCAEGRIVAIPYGEDVTAAVREVVKAAYSRPLPLMIRAMDAIHAGSAKAARAKTLVATDARLREAAALVKLKALP